MKNRYLINQQLDGVRASLKEAVNKVEALYADPKSTVENRREAENVVKDLKERVQKYENDIREMDEEANKMVAKLDPKLFKNYKNVPENLKSSFFIVQNQMDEEMKNLIKNIKENDWYKNTKVSKGGFLIYEK